MIKLSCLNSDNEFKKLLRLKKIYTNYFILYFGKIYTNEVSNYLKISFVTKKKIGNAVKRNKIKRRLRNIVNDVVKKVSLEFDYSYLVIAKPTMLNNEYTIIKETLFRDLERIRK